MWYNINVVSNNILICQVKVKKNRAHYGERKGKSSMGPIYGALNCGPHMESKNVTFLLYKVFPRKNIWPSKIDKAR